MRPSSSEPPIRLLPVEWAEHGATQDSIIELLLLCPSAVAVGVQVKDLCLEVFLCCGHCWSSVPSWQEASACRSCGKPLPAAGEPPTTLTVFGRATDRCRARAEGWFDGVGETLAAQLWAEELTSLLLALDGRLTANSDLPTAPRMARAVVRRSLAELGVAETESYPKTWRRRLWPGG